MGMVSSKGRGPPYMSWTVLKNIVDPPSWRGNDGLPPPCDTAGVPAKKCTKWKDFPSLFNGFSRSTSSTNCFVYVENFWSDVKTCVKQYESWSGIPVNWEPI